MSVMVIVKELLKLIRITVAGAEAARVNSMADDLRRTLPGGATPQ